MTPVFWNDILEIVKSEDANSEVEFKSTGIRIFGNKENNLCSKAYQLLAKDFSLPPVKIHLHPRGYATYKGHVLPDGFLHDLIKLCFPVFDAVCFVFR